MNLAQLKALRAVHEAGSVTGAAALLGVTQSAVSHALASLESELGLRLAVRDRGGCSLTGPGRRLLPHALEALRHLDRLTEEAASLAGLTTGRLRIGVFPSVGGLLPPLMRAFGRLYPAVEVVLLEGTDEEILDWLDGRVVEIGVVTGPRDDLHTVPPAADELMAVLPAGHPLAGERDVALEELADDPFLLSTGGCETLIRRLYAERDVPLEPARRVREMGTLLAMIGEDLGVSVIPSLSLAGAGPGTVALPLRPAVTRRLLLAARSAADPGPAGAAFLDLVSAGGAAGNGVPATGKRPGPAPRP
jgi:DNA-binding transcriptional LysR family regulator